MSELLVIIPSRGRPDSLERVAAAWHATGAFADGAGLIFVVDGDDPLLPAYHHALDRLAAADPGPTPINLMCQPAWESMVPKLNRAAVLFAEQGHYALGFAGDDHLPRTRGWVTAYLGALRELGTGVVFGDDGIQHGALPTQWAMTSDIVRALGGMVPAPVEHLYCDNVVRDLGAAAGCLRYLPDVLIEHMHPVAGKGEMDEGYRRVNRPEQYRADRLRYLDWVADDMTRQAMMIRDLRKAPHGQ